MKKILYFLLIVVSTPILAQTSFNSLEQCVNFARENNPSLKGEKLNLEVSHQRVKSAWASLLPQVKAFGTFDNNLRLPVQLIPAQFLGGPEGQYAEVRFGTQFNTTVGAEASLSLINISNWKNIRSSAYAEKASEYQQKDRELNLIEQAITTYYFALLSYDATLLNKELVSSADSLVKAAEIRLRNGLIEPLEYNRAKAIYLEISQQLEESNGAYQTNIQSLKTLCGIQISDSLILSERLSQSLMQRVDSNLKITSLQMPRYHVLSYRKLQTQEDLKRQRVRTLPELSFIARYTRQSFSNQFNLFSNSQPWFEQGVIGLRAEWNLFTGFNRQASIRQASLQAKIAEYDLENYSLQADKELEELKTNYEISSSSARTYFEHYTLNTANHKIAIEKYKQGIYSIDQYITIYQELVASQNQYLNKLANYLVYQSIVNTRNSLQ